MLFVFSFKKSYQKAGIDNPTMNYLFKCRVFFSPSIKTEGRGMFSVDNFLVKPGLR